MSHGGGGGGGIRKKLHFRKFLACRRPLVKNDDQSQVGGPGFSRVVYCNDPDNLEALIPNYGDNYVGTSKYDLGTFFPKFLFEQFTRVVNVYFLIIGIMAFTPLAAYSASSAILPLTAMIGATMLKEAAEDWRRRKQDIEVNNHKVKVYSGEDGAFGDTEWRNLRVGDIVNVEKDNFFPADLLLLSSNYDEAICCVETSNVLCALFHVLALVLHEDAVARRRNFELELK